MAPYDFSGKRALVTGAASGFGKATALKLNELGAQVVALDINEKLLETVKRNIPNITTVCVDINNWDETQASIENILPIHLLVNNAGVGEGGSFLDITPHDLKETFGVNVFGTIAVTQVVVSDLIKRKMKGTIVNVSSIMGIRPESMAATYSASKASIISLTKSMVLEFSPKGIRTNAICPGFVTSTAMGNALVKKYPNMENMALEKTPLGRLAHEDDIVSSIVFLLHDSSEMINGSVIHLDGGMLLSA